MWRTLNGWPSGRIAIIQNTVSPVCCSTSLQPMATTGCSFECVYVEDPSGKVTYANIKTYANICYCLYIDSEELWQGIEGGICTFIIPLFATKTQKLFR